MIKADLSTHYANKLTLNLFPRILKYEKKVWRKSKYILNIHVFLDCAQSQDCPLLCVATLLDRIDKARVIKALIVKLDLVGDRSGTIVPESF